MVRHQSSQSATSSVTTSSSDADLTDDNGSSASSTDYDTDDVEEIDEDHCDDEGQEYRTDDALEAARTEQPVLVSSHSSTVSSGSKGMHRYLSQAISSNLRKVNLDVENAHDVQQAAHVSEHQTLRSKSSSNLFSRMLGHAQ